MGWEGDRFVIWIQGAVSWSGTPEAGVWGRWRLRTWGLNVPGICKNSIFRKPIQAGFWERMGTVVMS